MAIAARSLISLYRDVDPTMLHKKDRGRVAQENLGSFEAPRYGDFKPADHVPGAELLQAMLNKDTPSKTSEAGSNADSDDAGGSGTGDEESEWDGWEVASDEEIESDDDDGEWIDVHHSSDDEAGPSGASADAAAGAALLATASAKRDHLIEAERVRSGGKGVDARCVLGGPLTAFCVARRSDTRRQVLGPADFAAIKKLREQAELAKNTLSKGQKRRLVEEAAEAEYAPHWDNGEAGQPVLTRARTVRRCERAGRASSAGRVLRDDAVDEATLLRHAKRRKQTKEERLADIQRGREGREKYGSNKGQKERGSRTNKVGRRRDRLGMVMCGLALTVDRPACASGRDALQEKLKNKLFTMVKYKRDIRDKLKRSLREKQVCAVPRRLT